jgi:hypothetical protein
MPGTNRLFARKAGVWGTALFAYDIWRRIPARHRKALLLQARKHGPRIAKQAIQKRKKR